VTLKSSLSSSCKAWQSLQTLTIACARFMPGHVRTPMPKGTCVPDVAKAAPPAPGPTKSSGPPAVLVVLIRVLTRDPLWPGCRNRHGQYRSGAKAPVHSTQNHKQKILLFHIWHKTPQARDTGHSQDLTTSKQDL
jgi:hypothetical protein